MKRTLVLVLQAALLGSCGSVSESAKKSEYAAPNPLLRGEIQRRIDSIPYQHKEELLDNMLWLAAQGEVAMEQLIDALSAQDPKTRSSSTWCLGRIGDKRSIAAVRQRADTEEDEIVRLELARTLLLLGDFSKTPTLIAGLESDRRHVRYLCYEALRQQTGNDFGYDHRVEDPTERAKAVRRWREWWSTQSSDRMLQTGANTQGVQRSYDGAGQRDQRPTGNVGTGAQPQAQASPAPGEAQPQSQTQPQTQPDTRPDTQPSSRPGESTVIEFK